MDIRDYGMTLLATLALSTGKADTARPQERSIAVRAGLGLTTLVSDPGWRSDVGRMFGLQATLFGRGPLSVRGEIAVSQWKTHQPSQTDPAGTPAMDVHFDYLEIAPIFVFNVATSIHAVRPTLHFGPSLAVRIGCATAFDQAHTFFDAAPPGEFVACRSRQPELLAIGIPFGSPRRLQPRVNGGVGVEIATARTRIGAEIRLTYGVGSVALNPNAHHLGGFVVITVGRLR